MFPKSQFRTINMELEDLTPGLKRLVDRVRHGYGHRLQADGARWPVGHGRSCGCQLHPEPGPHTSSEQFQHQFPDAPVQHVRAYMGPGQDVGRLLLGRARSTPSHLQVKKERIYCKPCITCVITDSYVSW